MGSVMVGRKALAAGSEEMAAASLPSPLGGRVPVGYARLRRNVKSLCREHPASEKLGELRAGASIRLFSQKMDRNCCSGFGG